MTDDLKVERVAQILAANDPLRQPHRGAGPWKPPPIQDHHRNLARLIVTTLNEMEADGE